jgi:DNA polymerase I-like protein with 3'-5' exonuclease and polymerase domains
MKRALVIAYIELSRKELPFLMVANVHDELQIETEPAHADAVGETVRQAIVDAGVFYNMRIPLDGEYKVGSTWADTH